MNRSANKRQGIGILLVLSTVFLTACVDISGIKEDIESRVKATTSSYGKPVAAEQGWNNLGTAGSESGWLLEQLEGKQFRSLMGRSLQRHKNAKKAASHLSAALVQSSKAQNLVKETFDMRTGNGASLNVVWEKPLWATFEAQLHNAKNEKELTQQDDEGSSL